MLKTVSDMYNYAKANDIKLLSSYDADFWDDYVINYEKYDSVFKRLYKSFVYFEQLDDEEVEDVVEDFVNAVEGHLMINEKKYAELYRMNVISDTDYSLIGNVDITEVMDKDGGKTEGQRQDSDTLGQRLDSSTTDIGAQTITDTSEVSPYDSENFYNDGRTGSSRGARHDSDSFTRGSQQNSYTKGSQSDTYSEDYTFTRKGNNGNVVASDMLNKHKKFWNLFEFYSYIFGEIAKEMLLNE